MSAVDLQRLDQVLPGTLVQRTDTYVLAVRMAADVVDDEGRPVFTLTRPGVQGGQIQEWPSDLEVRVIDPVAVGQFAVDASRRAEQARLVAAALLHKIAEHGMFVFSPDDFEAVRGKSFEVTREDTLTKVSLR